jgi:phosphoketolase
MVSASMAVQHAKWLEESRRLPWRTPIPSLNVLLTSTCWRNDHNGFSHQGPGLIDVLLSKKGTVSRVYLPPDANCLLSVADHCFRSQSYVNLIVIDKQPQLQWLDIDQAIAHCTRGVDLALGEQRSRGRARRGPGGGGRRPDAGGRGGGVVASPECAGDEGPGGQRRGPHDAVHPRRPPPRDG